MSRQLVENWRNDEHSKDCMRLRRWHREKDVYPELVVREVSRGRRMVGGDLEWH